MALIAILIRIIVNVAVVINLRLVFIAHFRMFYLFIDEKALRPRLQDSA